jgi:hypothetical protein
MRSAQSICLLAALSASAALLACSEAAQAALTYNIFENSGNVIIETQGSLNLPAPSPVSHLSCGTSLGGVWGSQVAICMGPNANIPSYSITGPSSFTGPVAFKFGTSTSGKMTVLYAGAGLFTIDSYLSGDPIAATTTIAGNTLASLGFTTRGTIGTWTVTGTGDTINVNVGNPVPGPLPLLGAATAFGFSRRQRRRIAHSQS